VSELPYLFIANSKSPSFLKKNLPLDYQKKFTCVHKNYNVELLAVPMLNVVN
jgi:hypothetical protein